MTPAYRGYFDEITPERLAEDPGDEIAKYHDGWVKNQSDATVAINMARSRERMTKKGNYLRMVNQMHRYVADDMDYARDE
jgi:hypothetical protein